jgi:hypothetical protein
MGSSLTRWLFKLLASVPARVVSTQPSQGSTLLAPNPSPRAKASNTVPSENEPPIACVHAFKHKCATLASQMALSQGIVLAQAPHAANVERRNHSIHIQLMHQSAFTRNTSTLPLIAVPPTVLSRTSMKGSPRSPLNSPWIILPPLLPI